MDRRERRRAGADDDAPGAAADGQEVAVAGGRPHVGGEGDVVAGAEQVGERGVDAGDVLHVGQAEQRPASAGAGRGGRVRQEQRPALGRGRGPDRAGRPTVAQVVEERRARAVVGPGGLRGRVVPLRVVVGSERGLLLGGGVPGRDGESQHVGAHPGVAAGDGTGEPGHRRAQHRLGADHAAQRGERARVGRARGARHEVAVDVLAGEPHLDPDPGSGDVVEGRGHGVVEGAVEVGQRHVDQHLRDRVGGGDLGLGGAAGPRGPGLGLGGLHRGAREPGQQLWLPRLAGRRGRHLGGRLGGRLGGSPARGSGGHGRIPTSHHPPRPAAATGRGNDHRPARGDPGGAVVVLSSWGAAGVRDAQAPTAAFRASARSVRSQVNSGSSRPKWPYAEVLA